MIEGLSSVVRQLRARPDHSTVAVLTIAIAIGANAAMFSFVNGALLRRLPYPDANRIVRLLERSPSGSLNGISTLNYLDWASQSVVFEYIAAETGWRATLTGGEEPVVIQGARVSARYFDIFGVKITRGRAFLGDEDQSGRDHVVLIAHALWRSRFGADPGILNRAITIDGEPHTVVGVLPEGGPFDRAAAQIWKPLAFEPSNLTRDYRWLTASAKLKPGLRPADAQVAMDVISQRLAGNYPASNRGWSIAVDRLSDVMVSSGLRVAVTTLFAATIFVLLIGAANLANLTIARAVSRDGEFAVRAALGASPRAITRMLITESIVLSLAGGAAGAGVGYALLQWIHTLIPPSSLPPAVEIRMDLPTLLFTLLMAVLIGLAVGLIAAARIVRLEPMDLLRGSSRNATASRGASRVRSGLVVAQIGLAFALVTASGLLMRSFVNLLDIDTDLDASHVLTAGLPVLPSKFPDPAALNSYLDAVTEAVGSVPGVRNAALTTALPLSGWGFGTRYAVAGRTADDRSPRPLAFLKIVSPPYFETVGIQLRAGRLLASSDRAGAEPVAVINETMARREFSGGDAVGHTLLVRQPVPARTELGAEIGWRIAGIVADERVTGLADEPSAGMYVTHWQSPSYSLNLAVRTSGPAQGSGRAIQSAVASVNRDQALSDIRTLDQVVAQSMLGNRVVNSLLTGFAGIALLLAAAGVYGVISYTAAERTQEMAIRAALGSDALHLGARIVVSAFRLTATGLAIGLAAALATGRWLSSMLYGVAANDLLTMALAAGAICVVTGLACLLPARRVMKADPGKLLRS